MRPRERKGRSVLDCGSFSCPAGYKLIQHYEIKCVFAWCSIVIQPNPEYPWRLGVYYLLCQTPAVCYPLLPYFPNWMWKLLSHNSQNGSEWNLLGKLLRWHTILGRTECCFHSFSTSDSRKLCSIWSRYSFFSFKVVSETQADFQAPQAPPYRHFLERRRRYQAVLGRRRRPKTRFRAPATRERRKI